MVERFEKRGIAALWVLFLGLLVCVRAQDPVAGAPQEAPALSPELAVKVKELREAEETSVAALRAEGLRTGTPVARDQLFLLLAEPPLREVVFSGILTCLEEARNRSRPDESPAPDEAQRQKSLNADVDRLTDLFAKVDGPKRLRLRDALRRFDAAEVVSRRLSDRFKLMGEGNGRGALIDVQLALVGSDAKRRDVVKAFVELAKVEKSPEGLRDFDRALRHLTFHAAGGPAAWDDWFKAYVKDHPDGFSERELANDAVEIAGREARTRGIAELQRAIMIMARRRVLPDEFLDSDRNVEPEVRRVAAEQMAVAVGAEEEPSKNAIALLLVSARKDPEASVRRASLKALGEIAKDQPKFRTDVATGIAALLETPEAPLDLVIAKQAVRSLRICNSPAAADALKTLYLQVVGRDDGVDLVCEIVSALAGLGKNEHLLADALRHKDKAVKAVAANSLLVAGKPEFARQLAEAVRTERNAEKKDPALQQTLLTTLIQLGNFKPAEVVEVLREAAADQRLQRDAWGGLMNALVATPERRPDDASCEQVAAFLSGVYAAQPKPARVFLIESFGERSRIELLPVLGTWWVAETDDALRTSLAQVFQRLRPIDLPLGTEIAKSLVKAGQGASAEIVARWSLQREPGTESAARDPARVHAARRCLADALILEPRTEAWTEAELILGEELDATPLDMTLRRQRGFVRLKLKKKKDALEDLRLVYDAGTDALPLLDRRALVNALAELYLDLEMPAESQAVLSSLTEEEKSDRQSLFLRAASHLALDQVQPAYSAATEALALEGSQSDTDLLKIQLQSGLRLRNPDARERAASAFERLTTTRPSLDLTSLEPKIISDRRLRNLVLQLDRLAPSSPTTTLDADLLAAPPAESATWLLAGLKDLASKGLPSEPALSRRLSLLKRLYPEAKDLQSILLPPDPSTYPSFADQLLLWWTKISP